MRKHIFSFTELILLLAVLVVRLLAEDAVIGLIDSFQPGVATWLNENPIAVLVFWLLIIISTILWEQLKLRDTTIREFKERLRPKLSLSCGKDVPESRIIGTVRKRHQFQRTSPPRHTTCHSGYDGGTSTMLPLKFLDYEALFLRVAVTSECETELSGCHAEIAHIEAKGSGISNNLTMQVPFSPAHDGDAFAKRIPGKETEYVDVFTILTCDNRFVSLARNRTHLFSHDLARIFEETGDYILRLIVSGPDIVTHEALLEFHWSGDYKTTELSCYEKNVSA